MVRKSFALLEKISVIDKCKNIKQQNIFLSDKFIQNASDGSDNSYEKRIGVQMQPKDGARIMLNALVEKRYQWKLKLLENIQKIITDKSFIRLERIEDDHVIFRVPHPAIAAELRFSHTSLLDKINSLFDRPRIKTIIYTVGPIDKYRL